MSDCIFCRIARGAIPAGRLIETDQALVFEDANPQAPVHLLVIPKLHVESIIDADALLLGHLLDLAARAAIDRGLSTSGFRVVTNTGLDAGQSVPHLHLHVLGGRSLGWPPG